MENSKQFVSIREAAELSGLPQHFWRKAIAAGNIPHLKSGNKFYIDYERAIAELRGVIKSGNKFYIDYERAIAELRGVIK